MGVLGGAIFGGLFFYWIAGWRVIDPTQIEWLMKLDWRINFLGWHLYRNDPWLNPPGAIVGYLAGEGTTIGLTDSVPLAAMLLKPFDAWLPTPFQYFGLWLLACFVLQGAFGARLAGFYTRNPLLQITGATLFVLLPTLLIRVGHPALTAHFLLLWALSLYLGSQGAKRPSIGAHVALGLVAGSTHPYLAAMVLALLASIPLRDRTRRSMMVFGAAVLATLVAWWAAGFISVSSTDDLSAGGLGLYSMNLLSPLTPRGWSTIVPELPIAHEMQAYEGFQYLGVGTLALLLFAAGVWAVNRRDMSWRRTWPLVAIALLCALYALSPRVTFGNAVLVDWSNPLIDRVAFFRASGRFFWPMTYLLLTAAIAAVVSRLRASLALAVLTAAVAVQFVDQANAHAERRATSRSEAFHAWPRRLVSRTWHDVLPHYTHVVIVPASQCGGAPIEHEELAYLAGLHELTINSGLGARWDTAARRRYCGALDLAISEGEIDDDVVYVVTPEYEQRMRAAARQPVVCGTIDIARVCVTEASFVRWRERTEGSASFR
jgi:hypothetical protein